MGGWGALRLCVPAWLFKKRMRGKWEGKTGENKSPRRKGSPSGARQPRFRVKCSAAAHPVPVNHVQHFQATSVFALNKHFYTFVIANPEISRFYESRMNSSPQHDWSRNFLL